MTKLPNMFRTFENSNFDIVSDWVPLGHFVSDFVLRDSSFDVSMDTISYGATSSNYFWDVILESIPRQVSQATTLESRLHLDN
jgi:hypothetical protein